MFVNTQQLQTEKRNSDVGENIKIYIKVMEPMIVTRIIKKSWSKLTERVKHY